MNPTPHDADATSQKKDRSRMSLLLAVVAATAAVVWVSLEYAKTGDLQDRITIQRKRLTRADEIRLDTIKQRQQAGGRLAETLILKDPVSFMTKTAETCGITGTKLKAIRDVPPVPRDLVVEKGYSVELEGIDRQSLVKFLVEVETLQPSLRTRELHIRRFTPDGGVVGANAVLVYHEKKPADKKATEKK